MISRLQRYVATPSLSREEAALADLVAADLEAAGLRVRRQANNLWTELGDAPRPRLLLNSHLDTVPPGAGWTGDPFSPQLRDGRLTGLGANDAKGCVTAMIEAAIALSDTLHRGRPLGGTLVLALTAEEEISGNGLGTILEQVLPIDAAIVGEPTGLTPMTAQRGLLILRAVARGRTAHPANTPPERASNAIVAAARDIARLQDFDWGPPHPLLGRTHANVTKINGGVALNVIPDACEFFIDVRTTPGESHRQLCERLRRVLECELHIRSERLVPVSTDTSQPIVQAVLRALPGSQPSGSPAMSDMVFLAGTPAVKIGPGQSPRSHTPDEYLLVDELHAGAAAYERIAREFFAAEAIASTGAAAAGGARRT